MLKYVYLLSLSDIYLPLLLLNNSSGAKYSEYCALGKENTPCKFRGRVGSACGGVKFTNLKDFEREIILNKHNELRQAVAVGRYFTQHLPNATDMNVMSWDKETEFFAREHVKQCVYAHDKVRKCLNKDWLGQNLATSYHQEHGMDKKYFEAMVQMWFDEIKKIDDKYSEQIKNYHFQYETGHLSQVLWAKTKYIGCAKFYNLRKDVPAGSHAYDFTCNYRTAGNNDGQPIYTIGKSACAKPNSKYYALCGDIRPFEDDTYVAPDNGEIYLCQHLVIITTLIIVYYSTKLWI